MNNPEKPKIIDLNSYRKNRDSGEQPSIADAEQSDARYSADEQAIIDRLNHPHPAGKKLAFDKLVERPDLMVRFIEDKLRTNGYSEDVIDGVRLLAEAESDLRPEELSQILYVQYTPLMKTTYEKNEQRVAEAVKANRDAKAARASFRLIDSQKSQDD